MLALEPAQAEQVKAIVARLAPGCQILAFGSRVTGKHRPESDLDLALKGRGPLDPATVWEIREAFQESDLPMRVDVLDYHAISPQFRAVVDGQAEIMR